MGNKMKKLICALLASAMLVGSVGVVGFADEDTNAETVVTTSAEATEKPTDAEATEAPAGAEATEAPAVTEAPVATVAPTTSGSSYDNDSYYDKALSLCSALGIITGYEDGSVKPDSKVTRAEMASIVLRMLDLTSTSTYQNGFTDVTSSHWAADQIQTALEANIISGMGDGTFVPDGEVTYAQVCVMLVNAMNYQDDAEYYGGYPNGYIKVAGMSDLEITKNAPGAADVASDRGVVIKMVYNALLGQYKEINGYENGAPTYKANGTLAKAKFDVIDKKGVLTATSKTSVSSTDVQDGQIEIVSDDDDEAKLFDCDLTGLEDYLAQKITYYYKENSGLTPKVLAVTYDASKTTTFKADADDIQTVEGFDTDGGKFKIEGVSKKKDCAGASIVYNGKIISNSQLAELGESINDLLLPEKGSIRLVDSDKDDVFDVVFVDSYETMVVSSATDERIVGKVADNDNFGDTKNLTIKLDDSEDRTISVTKAGNEIRLRNLKKNDVATIRRSLDDTVVDVVVTGESFTGSASGISKKVDKSYATINGTKYDVANVAVGDLVSGTQSTFYTDMFGRIAYIESTAGGLLQSGEKYGWIMNGYDAEDGSGYILEIMTQDGKSAEYKLGSSLDYWAPTATAATTLSSKEEAKSTISALMASNSFIVAKNSKNVVVGPVRLIKYKVNSSDNITRIYCAVDSSKVSDDKALRIDPTNLNGVSIVGNLVGGYKINDGIVEISVPKSAEDMKNADNYKVGTVTASSYAVRENGSSRDYVVGEFENTNAPTVIINFTSSADALANLGDIDTNANNPVMVVDEIERGVDDDDNTVYTIHGYVNGAEASFTTTKNSVLGQLDTSSAIINSARDYNTKDLWNAKADEDISKYLSEGDLVLYDTGERLVKLLDADDVYNVVQNGASKTGLLFGSFNPFAARNMFAFGALLDSDFTENARVTIDTPALNNIEFDTSKLMDTIEINIKTGAADIDTDGSEISDLITYDAESKTGDYVFARFADKGTIQEIIVYRFVN